MERVTIGRGVFGSASFIVAVVAGLEGLWPSSLICLAISWIALSQWLPRRGRVLLTLWPGAGVTLIDLPGLALGLAGALRLFLTR